MTNALFNGVVDSRTPDVIVRASHSLMLLLLAIAACGPEVSGEQDLLIELQPDDGSMITSYRIVIAENSDKVLRIFCPDDGVSEKVRCTDKGVAIRSTTKAKTITVKARGYAFETVTITEQNLKNNHLFFELKSLSPFEVTDAYRTGFNPSEAEADFIELAIDSKTEIGLVYSVKFYIDDIHNTPIVYFQNTRRYPIHYDFVYNALGRLQSRESFDFNTYRGETRTALAGTLLYRPSLVFRDEAADDDLHAPITLEFFPSDDLSGELALAAHRLIEERLGFASFGGNEKRLVYLPAGELQEENLVASIETFAKQDALWSTLVEVYAGVNEQLLNPGIAFGTLRRLSPEQLENMAVSYRDILVLTRLPNDLPLVGGTLTEEFQTPLAHVNVAARARGTPNASLRSAGTDPRVAPLLGRLVRYEVTNDEFSISEASQAEAEAFWNARAPEKLVPESDLSFTDLVKFDELGFSDAIRVGNKAANLAELRRAIGDFAPIGFAVPFSAYIDYMTGNVVSKAICEDTNQTCKIQNPETAPCDDVYSGCLVHAQAGSSFLEYIDALLDADSFNVDTAFRKTALDGLKYMISQGTVYPSFGEALDVRVGELFGNSQVRLRSSSNTEDLPGFSGAGLYDSVSAEASGTDRASLEIRKVWASLWGWRAFEERAFWNVDQRAVCMGVAVNRAFDNEFANGVLITRDISGSAEAGLYVNVQKGEVSITNPPGEQLPEIFVILPAPRGEVQVARHRFSSLSLGQSLMSDDEVSKLADAAYRIVDHFGPLYGESAQDLTLDLEFKLIAPNRDLLIKQVRPYSGH